jgi:Na+/melibiose symporter-like transporter
MIVAHIPNLSPWILLLMFPAGVLTASFFIKKTPTSEVVTIGLIFAAIAAFLIYAMIAIR